MPRQKTRRRRRRRLRPVAAVRRRWETIRSAIRTYVEVQELLLAAGLVLVGYGCAEAWRPAGFIVPGLVLLWYALPPRPSFFADLTAPHEDGADDVRGQHDGTTQSST